MLPYVIPPAIHDAIQHEREYQRQRWGPDTVFDDANTANDWAMYIADYVTRACRGEGLANTVRTKEGQEHFEKHMIKVAALAIAAIEASHRNDGPALRHYD